MASRQLDLPQQQASDLGTLWSKAVSDYMHKTKTDLSALQAYNIGDIIDGAFDERDRFHKFRRNDDKSSKLRKILGEHIGGMQKCMTGITMVGNAAAIFPPAMPVTIVFAACSKVLGLCLRAPIQLR
jgi:hypothetical protein